MTPPQPEGEAAPRTADRVARCVRCGKPNVVDYAFLFDTDDTIEDMCDCPPPPCRGCNGSGRMLGGGRSGGGTPAPIHEITCVVCKGTGHAPAVAPPAESRPSEEAQNRTIPDTAPVPYAEWTDSMLVREAGRALAAHVGRFAEPDRYDARQRLYRIANRLRSEELAASRRPASEAPAEPSEPGALGHGHLRGWLKAARQFSPDKTARFEIADVESVLADLSRTQEALRALRDAANGVLAAHDCRHLDITASLNHLRAALTSEDFTNGR